MNTLKLLILLILTNLNVALNGQDHQNVSIPVRDFTDNPWSFEPTRAQFVALYGSLMKEEKFTIKNRLNPSQKDTISRFFKGKSEVFFYKPYNAEAHFMTANIFHEKLKLKGDICVGISRKELLSKIAFPDTGGDTISISLPDGIYKTSLILKHDRIDQIRIETKKPSIIIR
jgi:hypothetical protein